MKQTTDKERSGKVHLSVDQLEAGLSPLAQRSVSSKGRLHPEEPCTLRSPFQRDRDRILHSKSFRRLKHKTQVFISPEGDHYRTRLTHTLEVSGIARTIARALRLNEDLTEAIALGHDLGHTPFGHAGEEVLDEVQRNLGQPGFKHNEQSVRVVEVLEKDGKGLNLTWEVRDGIRCHTGEQLPATLEGRIVCISDRIAYINHDIDDALRAGLISPSDLPVSPLSLLGKTGSKRIDTLVHDLVDTSYEQGDITQSPDIKAAMTELREFLFETVYERSSKQMGGQGVRQVLQQLMMYYLSNPQELPSLLLKTESFGADRGRSKELSIPSVEVEVKVEAEVARAVTDHIAGMTDRYAERIYTDLFLPKFWAIP